MSWNNIMPAEMFMDDVKPKSHSHYFKDVSQLSVIDVYRTLILFGVTDPCIQHTVKKLLVAGGRGAGKDISQDIQEAIDSLERWKEMRQEDNPIYNRRTEDKTQEVASKPVEVNEQYKTTGRFKSGDKVSIHDVTEACIPEEFEGSIGEVLYENGHDYSVKFTQDFHHAAEPVWCVYEWQMHLVEEDRVTFKAGDKVRVVRLVPGVPEQTFGMEGVVTETYGEGEPEVRYQVMFPDLDDYWYLNLDEIEHV